MNRWWSARSSAQVFLRRARRSTLAQNALALYGVQFAGYLLPLVTIPYLARVLRPEGWGLVVFAQSFAAWLSLLLQYGFPFSATRAVAQRRGDPQRIAATVAGVQGAKLLLLTLLCGAGVVAFWFVPVFRAHPVYLMWAWIGAVVYGFSPMWYFQGMERLRSPALLDIGTRTVAALGIFLWVRTESDGWRVLALNAVGGIVSVGVMTRWMYGEVRAILCSVSEAVESLREGWTLFVFASAASVYTTANSFILGLLAPPQTVSFYGAGEKLIRAVLGLFLPLAQVLYPRISHLVARDRAHAAVLVRRSLVPITGLGVILGVAIAAAAPLLIRVLLGRDYLPAVAVLRVLALLPPLIGLGTVLGIQWALPLGLDRIYNRYVLGAGVLNVGLAVLLVPAFGAPGMAAAVVVAEAFVEIGLVWTFVRVRRGSGVRRSEQRTGEPGGPSGGSAPLVASEPGRDS